MTMRVFGRVEGGRLLLLGYSHFPPSGRPLVVMRGEAVVELFRPVQVAYGRAKRTHAAFAGRHGLPERTFEAQSAGLPSTGAKGFIENAAGAARNAGNILATLQDSPLPLEVGDVELRAGMAEVRALIDDLPRRARELLRTLGR